VFPARYKLNSYIVFRKRLVSKRLRNLLFCFSIVFVSGSFPIFGVMLLPNTCSVCDFEGFAILWFCLAILNDFLVGATAPIGKLP
jgi:hypothetical protein